ncbi:MAG: SDR family oxidoreductase, partial [Pirellulales bacterium]
MPSRRNANSRDQNQLKNSQRVDIARELAEYAEVQAETLLTFDHEILTQSKWTVLPPKSQVDSTNSVHFILELELPAWLSECECIPLGMRADGNGSVQVLTPGSITPSVVIDPKNNLIAVHATELATKFELANSIASLVGLDATAVESQVRSRNLVGDWWILVVDTKRLTVDHWQMRNQIFSHASCELNRWSGNDAISPGNCSKLGFDSASQTWTIIARNKALTKPTRQTVKQTSAGIVERAEATIGDQTAQHSSLSDNQASTSSNNDHYPRMYEELNFFAAFATPEAKEVLCEQPTTTRDDYSPVSNPQEPDSPRGIQAAPQTLEVLEPTESSRSAGSPNIAQRYILRLAPAPQMEVPGRQPTWSGAAVVVGDNPIANQLESRLRESGVEVIRMIADGCSETQLADQFAELANTKRLPHLFITSPCDSDAKITLEPRDWQLRRNVGLMNIFWLCQRWFDHITSLNFTDDASLIAVSSMGGDFGISGNIHSAEGGGINGLLKSILIESWMQGYRSLPIKTIDSHPQQSPAEIVNIIWRELAIPSYDNEIAYVSGTRHILKAIPRSSSSAVPRSNSSTEAAKERSTKLSERKPLRSITRGGNWVFTGGARGITALVAERLATRYGLTLHLIGTAPSPNIDPAWRALDAEGLRQLKLQVMTEARQIGKNPVKHWQDTEKQMEIDATLRRLSDSGVQVHYHSCDVANRVQLLETLQFIRQISGPIAGVVHGAGVGRDARFDRKQPEKVHQCIAAKVDGALSLMQATWHDPLEVFVGFGSISGRFGANGHTDYSLSNEMLCKQIDWLKRQRPEVRAIGFHWHAWGDVGMATKPETKLALEMIHMQFMPAEEGIQHLIHELEADANESEVLITDDRYYRAFYPAETLIEAKSTVEGAIETPLLIPASTPSSQQSAQQTQKNWLATVHPVKDPFLAEHLLDGAPLLPFVVATEMLREAAAAYFSSNNILLRDITAHGAVRFFSDSAQDLTLVASGTSDRSQIELRSDFVSRKGIVVDRNRLNFSAQSIAQTSNALARGCVQLP